MAMEKNQIYELPYFKGLKTKHVFDSLTGSVSR